MSTVSIQYRSGVYFLHSGPTANTIEVRSIALTYANSVNTITVVPNSNLQIVSIFVDPQLTGVTIRTINDVLAPVAANTWNLTKGTEYIITLSSTSDENIGNIMVRFSTAVILSMSDVFAAGIVDNYTNKPSTVTTSVDPVTGTRTYTFTNHVLTKGNLFLASADDALMSGTANVVSSNPSIILSYTQPFSPNNSMTFKPDVLVSTTFTGTVTISINGVGGITPVAAIPYIPLLNQTSTPAYTLANRKRIFPSDYITVGSNKNEDKKIRQDNESQQMN